MTKIIFLAICSIICFIKVFFDLDNPKTFNAVKDFIYFIIGIFCVITIFCLTNKT